MSLPTLAGLDQLEARLGQTIDAPVQALSLLRYASARIRSHTGQTYVDEDGELIELPDGVVEVCVEMVYRAVTNPTGATQDTAGPFTVSFGSDAAQRIYLSRQDKAILRGGSTAFTIDTTPAGADLSPLLGAAVNGPDGWAPGE